MTLLLKKVYFYTVVILFSVLLQADGIKKQNIDDVLSKDIQQLLYQQKVVDVERKSAMYFQKAMELYHEKSYLKAISYFKKSEQLNLSLKQPNFRNLSIIYLNMAKSYQQLEKFNRAEKYFKSAVYYADKLDKKNTRWILPVYSEYVSFLDSDIYDYDLAKKYFNKIINLATIESRNEPTRSRVISLLNLSIVLDKSDMIKRSLDMCMEAKKIVEKYPNLGVRLKVTTYEYISDEYFRLGNYNLAFEYLTKSLNFVHSHNGQYTPSIFQIKLRIASIFRKLGMYNNSLKEYNELIPYQSSMPWKMRYDLYNDIGIDLKHLRRYRESEKYYMRAYDLWHRYTNLPDAPMENNLAMLYKDQNRTGEAIKHLFRAIDIHRQLYGEERNTALAINYMNLASLYDDLGRYKEAEVYYRKSLEIRKRVYGPQSDPVYSLFSNMAVLYHHAGNQKKAYIYAARAFNGYTKLIERVLPNLDRSKSRSYLQANKRFLDHFMEYGFNFYKQRSKGRDKIKAELLQGWLDYKGSQFDNLNIVTALLLGSSDKKINSLLRTLLSKERILARLYQTYPRQSERKRWEARIHETKAQIADLRRKISILLNRPEIKQRFSTISYRDISDNLNVNELYIDYVRTDKNYYLFSLNHSGKITLTKLDENTSQSIDRLIQNFRDDVHTIANEANLSADHLRSLKARDKQILSRLYTLVLAHPLGNEIGPKDKLIISPDGALRLLPFEALFDESKGQYLIQSKTIRYIPNGKELVRLYKYAFQTEQNQSVVFADPDFDADLAETISRGENADNRENNTNLDDTFTRIGIVRSLLKMRFAPLPGTKAEAQAIETIFGKGHVKEYEETNATESNLLKIKRPKILHIATHGFFINDKNISNPMLKSGIALSGANASAVRGRGYGIVTALKLAGLDLRGTDLVVLSACNTGVVDSRSTESVSGLAKAFIQAGANDIVMSLWPVNDQSTKELMASFYRQVSQGQGGYSEALRTAKLRMIQQGLHPYFWAPFILSGR